MNQNSTTLSTSIWSQFSATRHRYNHLAHVLKYSCMFTLIVMSFLVPFPTNTHAVETYLLNSETRPCVDNLLYNVDESRHSAIICQRGGISGLPDFPNHQCKLTGNMSTSFSQFKTQVRSDPEDLITGKLQQEGGRMTWEDLHVLVDVDRKRLSRRHLMQSSGNPSRVGFGLGGNADPQAAG